MVSLGFNLILITAVYKLFVKLQVSRIYPLGYVDQIHKIRSNPYPLKPLKPTLLFVGDSRASMWDSAALKKSFDVVNLAHGGQTSSQVLFQLLTQKLPDCDWVVIQVGINDLHPLGGLPGIKTDIISKLKSNLTKICKLFMDQNKKIVLITLFPPSEVPYHRQIFWDSNMNQILQKINHYIALLCRQQSIYLLDAYDLMANANGKLTSIYRDQDFFLHVNKKAYRILNEKLIMIINREE